MATPDPVTIGEKVDYVLSAGDSGGGNHHCHWPGCGKKVPPAKWGCSRHWFMLPPGLRRAIWQAYQPGQEITKTPSKQYIRVAQLVREWIEDNYCSDCGCKKIDGICQNYGCE